MGVSMSNFTNKDQKGNANIVDLASFRKQKEVTEDFAPGRSKPLYASHKNGKVTGSPHLKSPEASDFGDRLTRIRTSLDKINRLMAELKKMSSEDAKSQIETGASKR